jgi:ketohexokinase
MTHAEFIQQLSSAKSPFSWIHFEGRIPETTLQNISSLAEDQRSGLSERGVTRDTIISIEAEKPGREGLRELMRFADVIFISKTWAEVSVPGAPPVRVSTKAGAFHAL